VRVLRSSLSVQEGFLTEQIPFIISNSVLLKEPSKFLFEISFSVVDLLVVDIPCDSFTPRVTDRKASIPSLPSESRVAQLLLHPGCGV
jgi:hypothetical protein